MKIIVLILMAITFAIGNVNSQVKRTSTKRTTTSVAAKKKAEAKAEAEVKAQAEAKALAEAEAKEQLRREANNTNCEFGFDDGGLYSKQDVANDYVIYEIPNMSAGDLKAATLSAISSLYKSPKDVVTNLGDNIIQLDRYVPAIYSKYTSGGDEIPYDMEYSMIIQFKDGKIRYNIPSVKQMWLTAPIIGRFRVDMDKPLSDIIEEINQRSLVIKEFNSLISVINARILKANDW